jgi:hypothetical protein
LRDFSRAIGRESAPFYDAARTSLRDGRNRRLGKKDLAMNRSTLSALALTAIVAALSGCSGYRAMSDCGGCGIPGGWRSAGGCDPCGAAGPCGPMRSGAPFDRTYCVPASPSQHLCGLFGGCGGGCGEVYWGEWISDPPDACDPCDQCGNYVGPQWCPEWMRYTRFVPWGYRNGSCACKGCGGGGPGCGVMKSGGCGGGCSVCGETVGGGCGCGGASMPVSYEPHSVSPVYNSGCSSCGY